MKKRKLDDTRVNHIARRIEYQEATMQNSFGCVDRDWDRTEETIDELSSRLRERGMF